MKEIWLPYTNDWSLSESTWNKLQSKFKSWSHTQSLPGWLKPMNTSLWLSIIRKKNYFLIPSIYVCVSTASNQMTRLTRLIFWSHSIDPFHFFPNINHYNHNMQRSRRYSHLLLSRLQIRLIYYPQWCPTRTTRNSIDLHQLGRTVQEKKLHHSSSSYRQHAP